MWYLQNFLAKPNEKRRVFRAIWKKNSMCAGISDKWCLLTIYYTLSLIITYKFSVPLSFEKLINPLKLWKERWKYFFWNAEPVHDAPTCGSQRGLRVSTSLKSSSLERTPLTMKNAGENVLMKYLPVWTVFFLLWYKFI